MSQRKNLHRELGKEYQFRQYYSYREVRSLPQCLSGVIAASVIAGCLRLDAVTVSRKGKLRLTYEFLVREKGGDWVPYDSPTEEVYLTEPAMVAVLERTRKRHKLPYTDLRFPKLPGTPRPSAP